MLIDRIYQKVKTFVNTDGRGNMNPEEFNLLLHNAIQARNEEYFYEVNRLINKENRGMITNALENTPDRYREKALHYLVDGSITYDADGIYTLPSDYRYFDSIGPDDTPYEFCKNNTTFIRTKPFARPLHPIFTFIGQKVKVYPFTAAADLEEPIDPDNPPTIPFTYLRKVKYPKWTYMVFNDAEVFNPDAVDFQDADIHPSEENEMVVKVLQGFGINLKEQDVVRQTAVDQELEFNQNYKA